MIRFERVEKRYGAVHALRGIDLTVREGEFAVLIGPSGCGKTTALKMVNRLLSPTQGRVLVGGEDVAAQNAVTLRRNIGYVIQETGLFPHMSIADNIGLVPRLKKWPKARRDERIDELLHLVGLDPKEYRHRYPRHLSGGQRQRVGVARALASDPPIILMDEPFGATDPITRKQLQAELDRIKRHVKKTVLFVTHDISEAFLLGDTVCLLRDGEVVQHATPEEMLRNPASSFVRDFIGQEVSLKRLEYMAMAEIASNTLLKLPAEMPVHRVAEQLQGAEDDCAVIVDEHGKLAGVVTRSSLTEVDAVSAPIREIPLPPATVVEADELVRECFPRLQSATEAIVVVDRARRPQGIVRYRDVVRLVAKLVSPADSATRGEAS